MIRRLSIAFCTVIYFSGIGFAQTPNLLTLKQAQSLALQKHPYIAAASMSSQAAAQTVIEQKSVYQPQVWGAVTGAGAEDGTRIAAGAFNNPSIFSRFAQGITVSQFITDFGRTSNLVQSADLGAQAAVKNVNATRADVLLDVDRAYFGALRAQAVLKVARETVTTRQNVLDQISAMEQSGLKSGLDVSFAKVSVAQAKLLLLQAENDLKSAFMQLSTAIGYRHQHQFDLVDEPAPPPLAATVDALIDRADRDRPDLQSIRLLRDSAYSFAEAEKDLWHPTISSIGAAGVIPLHVSSLQYTYAGAAVNISIPIFNGHLFSARRDEAEFRAKAQDAKVTAMENNINRDVQIAYLNAGTAYQNLAVTQQLLDESKEAFDLAQARYNLGLSSIVELSQAQLNLTEAQIANAAAMYQYQQRRAELDFQTGVLQ